MKDLFLKQHDVRSIIPNIESDLCKFDKVILMNSSSELLHGSLGTLMRILCENYSSKKILILLRDVEDGVKRNISVRRITEDEEFLLLRLYRMYEFSDKFSAIGYNMHCGTIMNYVKRGKLSLEKAFEALMRSR